MLVKEALDRFLELEQIKKDAAKEQDLIKSVVLEAVGVKQGTITVSINGFRVSTIGKLNRTVDASVWDEIKEEIPQELWPIKETLKLEPDVKMIHALQSANPLVWKKCAAAFTTKPGKPAVKVTRLKAANDG